MKNKIILLLLIIVGIITVVLGCPSPIMPDTRSAEIDVTTDSEAIVSGSTTIDFGTTSSSADMTFRITNSGDNALNLIGTPSLIAVAGDVTRFVVQQPPTTPLDPGNTTDFILRFVYGLGGGQFNATLTIANNDPNEADFNFNVTGFSIS